VLSKAAVDAIEARYADFKPSRREQAEKDAA
jgi:large subunit ribosomal protein L4